MTTKLWRRVSGFGHTIRELGYLDSFLYALARVFSGLSNNWLRIHKYYLVAQPVAKKDWLPAQRGKSFEIRQFAEADPLIKQIPRPEFVVPYRFDQGAVCFGALKAGTLVGFLWITLGPYREDELRCNYIPLPAGKSAWDFDVYVEAEHRNGIVFLKLWDAANRFLAARGFQWSLSRISAFNSGSIMSHSRMSARRIGAIFFLCLGSWQIAVSTVSPFFHLSTNAKSFPTYALNPEKTHGAGSPADASA